MGSIITKRNIIIAGILLVIIIIAASLLLSPEGTIPNGTVPTQGPLNISPTSPNSYSTGYRSFSEFLTSGRTEICTFSVNAGSGTSNGTVYAANGKVRSDFAINAQGRTVQEHLLIDSYMAYVWTNASDKGVKFAVQDKTQDLTNPSIFNCNPWTPNLSVFELPSNMVFTEISSGQPATP